MGLMQKALETYNSYEHKVGVVEAGKEPLAPVGHIIGTAKIEIQIDKEGNFKGAKKLIEKIENNGKEKIVPKKIIIPVTEKSSARTSGAEAHPLCEQIGYVSGQDREKFSLYVTQLEEWWNECHNEKLEAVLRYVKGGTIISDLEKAGLYEGEKNDKDLIGWTVIGTEGSGSVWTDKKLFVEWADYYKKRKMAEGLQVLSMISGNYGYEATQHLKGIVSSAGNAKIVSANDTINFTYRGERFLDADEAMSISYDDSQKAHNALKWIIANNGAFIGDNHRMRVFVCWDPVGTDVKTSILFGESVEKKDLFGYRQETKDAVHKSKDMFLGDRNYGELVIAAFEAATSGRIAVTYYRELEKSDFMERTEKWAGSCSWVKNIEGNPKSSPDIRTIARFAFGIERGDKVEIKGEVYGMHVQRLLSCRLDGTPFPRDIMTALVRNVSSPVRYSDNNWRTLLHVACASIRKYRYDRYKEDWNMALEPDKRDRSYQYGRLLAVLEKAERDTYGDEDKRQTNAARMWNAFVRDPDRTSAFIYGKLKTAYYKKLDNKWPKRSEFYDKLINEIREKIAECGEAERHGRSLSETYLFGYSLQMNALYAKKDSSVAVEDNRKTGNDNE